MSWNNCKKCILTSHNHITSALFKVLVALKLLHGTRSGAKGSTFEDIAMYMIKYFNLDGDIKSQVLASLKYGVKLHHIQKRKDKFSLVMPAASIHLAPCKYKNEEIERIQCVYPPVWKSSSCGESCSSQDYCCGRRKRHPHTSPCSALGFQEGQNRQETPCPSCKSCNSQRSKSICEQQSCSQMSIPRSSCDQCAPPPKRPKPCMMPRPCSPCGHRRKQKSLYDDYCQMCQKDEEEEDTCRPDTFTNCSCCHTK